MGSSDKTVKKIYARWILDSRGNPTVEAEAFSENIYARAAVPSGASTGSYEAIELRDQTSEFKGKGVKQAVQNITQKIAPKLAGMSVFEQLKIDNMMLELDGSPNKAKLGANAILAVSLAVAKLAAQVRKVSLYQYLYELAQNKARKNFLLPVPMANIINGGKHAGNELAIQEFMVLPINFKSFSRAVQALSEIYQTLKDLLNKKYGKTALNVGDEGGFAPNMKSSQEVFEILISAVEAANYSPKTDILFAIDAAASEFHKNGKYQIDGKQLNPGELIEYYRNLAGLYPIGSIEDPFNENDFQNFAELTKLLGTKLMIVGDDLFVSQSKRLQMGIEKKAGTSILLKVNQCGSLSEAIATAKLAYTNNYSVIVSHRSGETEDTFIADLAVGLNSGLIKTGAPARTERTCKYNQILRIEEELGAQATYAGNNFRTNWKNFL
jgi:enolase